MTDGSHRRLLGFAGLGFALTGALTWLISPIAMPDEAAAVAAAWTAVLGVALVRGTRERKAGGGLQGS